MRTQTRRQNIHVQLPFYGGAPPGLAAVGREITHSGLGGWVDRYAGFCAPLLLPAEEWRPSIYGRRCRRPPAAYPGTWASSPRTCPVWPCSGWGLPSLPGHPGSWWSLTPPFHPYRDPKGSWRSLLCGTGLRVTPSGRYPPPCSAEPGRSSSHLRDARPPGQPIRPTVYRRRALLPSAGNIDRC